MSQSKRQNDAFLTPAAIERMKRELDDLERNQRRPAADEVARTGAMGDLSENAAYQYAKGQLRRINSRIVSLQQRIANAIPIPESPKDGTIQIGSRVTVEVGGRQMTFEVLGSQETNPLRGRISYLSPLGSALIGHKEGEIVIVRAQGNETPYSIIRVE